ncbi:SDR family oxidoreductase [Rhodobacteraceae bacterium]|nr:SDR family oxidoreductase [Paracoccaceae bacterium]
MNVEKGTGQAPVPLRLVVLGAYGLIGAAVTRRLLDAGHQVTGVGRSVKAAEQVNLPITWQIFDIGTATTEDWRRALKDADVVVNAAGALQDSARDNLTAIHETAPKRIADAVVGTDTRIVQISAAGVSFDASTEFFRSKARGDAALRHAGLPLVILKPTLVLAPAAYGGTALLRAGAALPGILPKVLSESRIHCVLVDDLAEAVLDAVEGRISAGVEVDVTGPDAPNLPELLLLTRAWLGLRKARVEIPVPNLLLGFLTRAADVAGFLGWRSPLRTTAVQVLRDGVSGDPNALTVAGGKPCRGLAGIFRAMPATLQDRWFAQAYVALPLAIVILAVFWLASGLIGLAQVPAATAVLTFRGVGESIALLAVIGGGIADVVLGAAVLYRPWAKHACFGMILVSLGYLTAGTLLTPDIWVDPLGPFVKVLPGIALAWITMGFLDER